MCYSTAKKSILVFLLVFLMLEIFFLIFTFVFYHFSDETDLRKQVYSFLWSPEHFREMRQKRWLWDYDRTFFIQFFFRPLAVYSLTAIFLQSSFLPITMFNIIGVIQNKKFLMAPWILVTSCVIIGKKQIVLNFTYKILFRLIDIIMFSCTLSTSKVIFQFETCELRFNYSPEVFWSTLCSLLPQFFSFILHGKFLNQINNFLRISRFLFISKTM